MLRSISDCISRGTRMVARRRCPSLYRRRYRHDVWRPLRVRRPFRYLHETSSHPFIFCVVSSTKTNVTFVLLTSLVARRLRKNAFTQLWSLASASPSVYSGSHGQILHPSTGLSPLSLPLPSVSAWSSSSSLSSTTSSTPTSYMPLPFSPPILSSGPSLVQPSHYSRRICSKIWESIGRALSRRFWHWRACPSRFCFIGMGRKSGRGASMLQKRRGS